MDSPPSASGRGRFLVTIVLAVLASGAAVLMWRFSRPQSPSIAPGDQSEAPGFRDEVLLVVRGFRTNEFTGEIQAEVAVSNNTPQMLKVSHAVQILTDNGWAHTNGRIDQLRLVTDDDATINPFTEKLQYVDKPGATNSWRVLISYSVPDDSGKPTHRWLYGPELMP